MHTTYGFAITGLSVWPILVLGWIGLGLNACGVLSIKAGLRIINTSSIETNIII